MIYKQRSMPKKLIGLNALIPRLHPSHPEIQKIKEEFRIRKAGFGGEQHLDKHLAEFKLTASVNEETVIKLSEII